MPKTLIEKDCNGKIILTQDILKDILYYTPYTPHVYWMERRIEYFQNYKYPDNRMYLWNERYAYKVAGYIDKKTKTNYYTIRIAIFNKQYLAHRLIWLYMTGKWPLLQIDHIDGNSLNNRFSNLRDVSNTENSKNRKLPTNNKSGIIGVRFDKTEQRWISEIRIEKILIKIGRYDNIQDAAKARKEYEIKYGFHKNHGRIKK